jgi:predicted phage terminase large subunit-like protein
MTSLLVPPSPDLIEWAIRSEESRRSFHSFVREMWPVIEPGRTLINSWYVRAIADHLQAVHEGQFPNLLICIPPGFAKSTLVSVLWPAWCWLDMPWVRGLFGSYDEELTYRDSDKCRDIIQSNRYQKLFQPEWEIKSTINTKRYFANTMHGARKVYYMRSSHKTGWRATYVVVDDPLSAEHRYDKNIKEQCIDTWKTVMWSRANRSQHHAFIVVMQRLAEDDLAGYILDNYGDRYVKLILQNEFEPENRCVTYVPSSPEVPFFSDPRTKPNELLCPELFSEQDTAEAKVVLGEVDYIAQYQHRPIPLGGGRFKVQYFQYWKYSKMPYVVDLYHRSGKIDHIRIDRVSKFISADFASTEKTENDACSFGLWAMTNNNELMLLHRMNFREKEPQAIAYMKALFDMKQWGQIPPMYIAGENNGPGAALLDAMEAISLPVMRIHILKDKISRSTTAVVRIQSGQIFFPDYEVAPWMPEFVKELSSFPAGAHDDDVDMLSLAANTIYEASQGTGTPIVTVPTAEPRFNAARMKSDVSKSRLFTSSAGRNGGSGNGNGNRRKI